MIAKMYLRWFVINANLAPWYLLVAGILVLDARIPALWLGRGFIGIAIIMLATEAAPYLNKNLRKTIREQAAITDRAVQWTEEELKWAGKDKPDAAD